MSLHYSVVIRLNSGCPMVIATGESETGKSCQPLSTAIVATNFDLKKEER